MNRREFISGVSAGTVVAIAGCSDDVTGPDPTMIDVQQEGISFFVIVQNDGSDGDLLVTLTFLDRNETVLDRVSRTVYVRSGERRRVEFTRQPPEDTYTYEGAVELP